MLAKDPAERPTVAEAIAEIDRAFPALAAETPPPPPEQPTVHTVLPLGADRSVSAPRQQRDKRRRIVVAAAALFCLGLVVAGGLLFGPRFGSAGTISARTTITTTTTAAPSTTSATTTTAAPTTETPVTTENTPTTTTSTTTTTTTPPPPPCPGSPDCLEEPGVPVDLQWLDAPGWNIPSWSAPDDDGGAAITGYVVTLIDEISGTTTQHTWSPSEVGTRGFECLGLIDPQGEPLFSFTVAATNEVGTGDAAQSNATPGYRSNDPALPCYVGPTDPEGGNGGGDGDGGNGDGGGG
jgi:hypothetical protein